MFDIGIRRAEPNSHSVLGNMAAISPGRISYVPVEEEETSHILWPGEGGSAIKWTPGSDSKIDWPAEEV